MNSPQLLPDTPAGQNALKGPHRRIAGAIAELIRTNRGGQSIRLDGDWGTGKSTIVRLVAEEFAQPSDSDGLDVVVFEYDAWVHTGDPLRRAFFEALVARLRGRWIPKKTTDQLDYWDKKVLYLARRLKTSSKNARLVFEEGEQRVITLVLCAGVIAPLWSAALSALVRGSGFFTTALWTLAAGFGLYKVLRPVTGKTLSLFLRRSPETESLTVTESGEPSSLEFQEAFAELLDAALVGSGAEASNRRLVIVIDNLDRVSSAETQATWALLRSFLDNPAFRSRKWYERVWLLVPIAQPSAAAPVGSSKVGDTESALEKVFQVRFSVPQFTPHFWRTFFEDRMAEAFPSIDEKSRELVTSMYAEDASDGKFSPRAIITFINRLVALTIERAIPDDGGSDDQTDISLAVLAAYLLWEKNLPTSFDESTIPDYMTRISGQHDLVSLFKVLRFRVPSRKHTAYLRAQQDLAEIFSGQVNIESSSKRVRQLEEFFDSTLAAGQELKRFALHACTDFLGPIDTLADTVKRFVDEKRSFDNVIQAVMLDVRRTLESNALMALSPLRSQADIYTNQTMASIVSVISCAQDPDPIVAATCHLLETREPTPQQANNASIAALDCFLSDSVVADYLRRRSDILELGIDANVFIELINALDVDSTEALYRVTCHGKDEALAGQVSLALSRQQYDDGIGYVLRLLATRSPNLFNNVAKAIVDICAGALLSPGVVSFAFYMRPVYAMVKASDALSLSFIRQLDESGFLERVMTHFGQSADDSSFAFGAMWLVLWVRAEDGLMAAENSAPIRENRPLNAWIKGDSSFSPEHFKGMCSELLQIGVFRALDSLPLSSPLTEQIFSALLGLWGFERSAFDLRLPRAKRIEAFAEETFTSGEMKTRFVRAFREREGNLFRESGTDDATDESDTRENAGAP